MLRSRELISFLLPQPGEERKEGSCFVLGPKRPGLRPLPREGWGCPRRLAVQGHHSSEAEQLGNDAATCRLIPRTPEERTLSSTVMHRRTTSHCNTSKHGKPLRSLLSLVLLQDVQDMLFLTLKMQKVGRKRGFRQKFNIQNKVCIRIAVEIIWIAQLIPEECNCETRCERETALQKKKFTQNLAAKSQRSCGMAPVRHCHGFRWRSCWVCS